MPDALIYCRFSPRPDADTSTSNERQEERCRAFCLAHEYDVVGVWEDRNLSGGTIKRPGLQQAIASLSDGMVLVVDTSDRLARDMMVYLTIQRVVNEAGAQIAFADGTPPDSTPEGELVCGMLALFAQYQRKIIRKKTKAGLARKRDKGIYLGKCPIGYKRQGGKLVEDEEEQSHINKIMALSCNNVPIADIVLYCKAFFGTIRGKLWQERTIRRIIKRELEKKCSQ